MMKKIMYYFLASLLLLITAFPLSPAYGTDQSVARITQENMIVIPANSVFHIQDIFEVENTGDTPSGDWFIPLPLGAERVHLDNFSDKEFTVTQEGIQVLKPLEPGKNQIIITYSLPSSSKDIKFTKTSPFDVDEFYLYVPEYYAFNYESAASTINRSGSIQVRGTNYIKFSGNNFSSAHPLSITLTQTSPTLTAGNRLSEGYKVTGHPQFHVRVFNSKPFVYTNAHLWALYLFIMAGLGIAALSVLYKRRFNLDRNSPQNEFANEDEQFLTLKRKQDTLLQNIKKLDDNYLAGEIPQEEYANTRARYKKQLIQVKLQLRELV